MTITDKINELSEMMRIFLNRNDHDNAQRCVEIIADMLYTYHEEEYA